ncbi:MAG: proton-translocating NADH-quinone oxidoreductase subunit N [Pedosphaera sp.]|jgi:NADH-quinone oxidoreductase subunit N|nr:proton-translocating NADH-quinone oxidoreductase subunit N [Pedosphaera sp.]MEC7905458.1 NADH-quinone oxidoreductase subunit N [Verrucomicrobiota bacterium]
MNISASLLEIAVIALGVIVMLADLWTPSAHKPWLGRVSAMGLAAILLGSFAMEVTEPIAAFGGMYVLDGFALFFKRFFLIATALVLLMSSEYAKTFRNGTGEYMSLSLFALSGMMFAASANHFALLFVSLELITITFYILTSFQRHQTISLEAGIKYLILGALSSAFLIYGIALVYGASGTMRFDDLRDISATLSDHPLLLTGLLMILAGLGFKIAAFPFQIWSPDVYQGSPTSTTAFLAVGSKAAGFALLMRLLWVAVPDVALRWEPLLMGMAAITILYGNLCALPQRNLKRLLGYSSIAHAGYLMMGIAAMSLNGSSAILYYLGGYLFTVIAAFMVIILVMQHTGAEDIIQLAQLHQRAPGLAGVLSLAMVSLAGIPPLAGFFGKFLLFKAVLEQASVHSAYYLLVAIAIIGVVISLVYYLGVLRTLYWEKQQLVPEEIHVSPVSRFVLWVCAVLMIYLGILPNRLLEAANAAVESLKL